MLMHNESMVRVQHAYSMETILVSVHEPWQLKLQSNNFKIVRTIHIFKMVLNVNHRLFLFSLKYLFLI